jgi:predicted CXXCH cytochrome family protein
VAHAAQAPKLLKTGPTQAHFCFMCHGDGAISAPYDVKNGYTQATGSAVYASTAGGFVRQFVDVDNDGVIDAGELRPVTSRHNVWGFIYGDESGAVQDTTNIYYWIPGGSSQFTGSGFVCSSCHDPHAGGRTPDASGYIAGDASNANPRLLRKSITVQDAAYTDLYVSFKVATVGTFTYSATTSAVYRVVEYKSGSTRWCGACHNKFRTSNNDLNPGAGHANYYFGMWRHPMDAHVLPPPGFDGTIATGTPLEKAEQRLPRGLFYLSPGAQHSGYDDRLGVELATRRG